MGALVAYACSWPAGVVHMRNAVRALPCRQILESALHSIIMLVLRSYLDSGSPSGFGTFLEIDTTYEQTDSSVLSTL